MSSPRPRMVATEPAPVRVGVSACLIGRQVRYDGQHKRDAYVCETLARHVELVPICPEVEVGMGVPRDTLRLVRAGDLTRLVAPRTGRDFSAEMTAWAEARTRALAQAGLSGYVLKKDSPSCGLARVKVYASPGAEAPASRAGVGFFAAALRRNLPNLPAEDEGRLCDPGLRDSFVERVFAYHRVQALFRPKWTLGELVAFHAAQKLTLLAHSPAAYRSLGRLVASAKGLPRAELASRYVTELMAALARPAPPGRHANVLLHMVGYFKKTLDDDARRELVELIAAYREGRAPLVAPLTLLRHHVRRTGVAYLAAQVYLNPDPREQLLRNHA